ncbi:hypothetical protein MMC13_000241 [Lambiella insularis]|nr:hypothetical protein [Lambiella insularis]
MATPKDDFSGTPVIESTESDAVHVAAEDTTVTDDQWKAMRTVIEFVINYKDAEGHDPSKIFHKKVNKRVLPDYYEVIKEPIAISILKAKLVNREYKSFEEYVRDWALIVHNAQTYNRPDAGAYVDALTIKSLVERELKKQVDQSVITPEVAAWPDLGELPPVEALLLEEDEDEDDDDDEEDDDDEGEDSDDENGRRRRKRGRRSSIAISKRDGATKDEPGQRSLDVGSKKKRGRPPKVDTPMESRIKNVLKAIRKPKNDQGQIMIHHFEKLPDKATMPEYFVEIKEPIAIELIKRKQKRKKYQSVDHFMRDVDTMFNNAKSYNQDESQIYKDAVHLQAEAHRLAEVEKQRPDSDFVMEEGRIPLPNGILHNNELWQVGDWVHIQNANDVTKPIVAQIYRTWQDTEGQKWINACWYYRPEQTVHQYEKHFFPDEVVKTGQYRDHHIDEIIDRCFVMFFTRYSRGRPKGIPPNREVYVCEARYNEEKHKLNKIKTWASCLPDEVREKDYEMDLFDSLRKVKKVPSPLLHMLKDDAKDTDELPKPRWEADNAPPIVGGIYKGPRDENQSPPPEPTPTPPPQPPHPPPRQVSNMANHNENSYRRNSDLNIATEEAGRASGSTLTSARNNHLPTSYIQPQSTPQYHQHSVSPAPIQYHQHGQQTPSYTPQTHTSSFTQPPTQSHMDHYNAPQNRYTQQPSSARLGPLPGTNPVAQRTNEVYILPDQANAAIPEDIREQFQRDDEGHVLFFNKPPLDVLPPAKKGGVEGHSVKYVAAKLRRKLLLKQKRKADAAELQEAEAQSKKQKLDEGIQIAEDLESLERKAILAFVKQMDEGTDEIYKRDFGDEWQEAKAFVTKRIERAQADARAEKRLTEESERKRKEKSKISLNSAGPYLDDFDPRY